MSTIRLMTTIEAENKRLMAALQQLSETMDAKRQREVRLPEFDSDRGFEGEYWTRAAEAIMGAEPLQGSELAQALVRAFKGDAASWLMSFLSADMTWPAFRTRFARRFHRNETLAAYLLRPSAPRPGQALEDYLVSRYTDLRARVEGKTLEEILLAFVLQKMAKEDPQIREIAFTKNLKTVEEAQRELIPLSFKDYPFPEESTEPAPSTRRAPYQRNAARSKQQSDFEGEKRHRNCRMKSYRCSRKGHMAANCNLKIKTEREDSQED